MRKPASSKSSKSGARRTKAKVAKLDATKDAVKRENRNPQREATLIGALFSSQVAMARLMFQFSPMAMVAQQQAITLDTFTAALNGSLDGSLEDPGPNDDSE